MSRYALTRRAAVLIICSKCDMRTTWIAAAEGWLLLIWQVHSSSSSCKGTSGHLHIMGSNTMIFAVLKAWLMLPLHCVINWEVFYTDLVLTVVYHAVMSGEWCWHSTIITSWCCCHTHLCSIDRQHRCQTWSTTSRSSGNSHLFAFFCSAGLAWLCSGNSHLFVFLPAVQGFPDCVQVTLTCLS